MSAALSCVPPISESNAGLNAWKFARSPRQWSGFVALTPRSVCVVIGPFIGWKLARPMLNGNGCPAGAACSVPAGSPRSHARPSMSPSTWHEAQDMVPLPESFAS
jgi:hypothetical protein